MPVRRPPWGVAVQLEAGITDRVWARAAPVAIASALIERGALRSLRDAKGRTALDVAVQRGHRGDLVELLTPPPSPLTPERILALDTNLGAVIDARIREEGIDRSYSVRDLRKALRYPAPTLPGTSRARLPSAAPPCCDRTAMKVSHLHSSCQRLTAHVDRG